MKRIPTNPFVHDVLLTKLMELDSLRDGKLPRAFVQVIGLFGWAMIVGGATSQARARSSYTTTELERRPGFVGFYTARLSEGGTVTGYSRRLSGPTEYFPTVWPSGGQANFLGLPPLAIGGIAETLLSDGRYVGSIRYVQADDAVPVVWDTDGSRRELPLPNRFGWASLGVGSVIVGGTVPNSDIAVWQNDTLLGIVSDLPGSARASLDINSHGTYVGVWSGFNSTGNYVYGGFIGDGLSVRLVSIPGWEQTPAYGINDDGAIVGIHLTIGFTRVGYLARGDGAVSLSPLPGGVESPVWAINNHNDMVGLSTDIFGNETATVYFNGSLVPTDMNTLVDLTQLDAQGHDVRLVRGIDVNDAGQILVEAGDFTAGVYRYYVLTPIPDASAAASIGLLTLWHVRGRRRR